MLSTMAEYVLSSLSYRFRVKSAAVITQEIKKKRKGHRFHFEVTKYWFALSFLPISLPLSTKSEIGDHKYIMDH